MATAESLDMDPISQQLQHIQQRIDTACSYSGRPAGSVTLIGVSKSVGREEIDAAYAAGLRDFGENRIQDASAKFSDNWPADARRHMIGSLQSNKAGVAVRLFDLIHSVDRPSIIDALHKQAVRHERNVAVLLQVNVAREAQKSGCAPEDAHRLAADIAAIPELQLRGLMTIAPLVQHVEDVRPVFSDLRSLRDELSDRLSIPLPILSMGMTNDFEIAISEGATHVRIGRALFDPAIN